MYNTYGHGKDLGAPVGDSWEICWYEILPLLTKLALKLSHAYTENIIWLATQKFCNCNQCVMTKICIWSYMITWMLTLQFASVTVVMETWLLPIVTHTHTHAHMHSRPVNQCWINWLIDWLLLGWLSSFSQLIGRSHDHHLCLFCLVKFTITSCKWKDNQVSDA